MYQPQNPDYSSPGSKRPRTGKSEGDWSCPNCGNVNFAFRTTCNMRKCSTPKPADGGLAPQQAPIQSYQAPPMYEQTMPQQYVGGPGVPQPMPSYAAPSSYNPPMMANPVPAQYTQSAPPQYQPQGGYMPVMGMQGPGYVTAPPIDNYGMNRGPPVMDVSQMVRSPYDLQQDGRKRRGGPEGGAEGDWLCPKCGNTNFAFRTVCNMRKCSAPKPVEAGGGFQGPPQGNRYENGGPAREAQAAPAAPDGSWTCKACGNLNYPFRTSCNRRNCGVEKPADGAAPGTNATASTTAAATVTAT